MKKMKAFAALALSASMLAGTCLMPQAAEAGEKTEKLVVAYPLINGVPADNKLIEEKINEIIEPKLGATVELMPISMGNYTTQVQLMLASGEKLDAFVIRSEQFNNYHSANQLTDMTPLLDEYGQGIKEAIGEEFLKAGQLDGSIYGITTLRDLAVGWGGLMARTDIMEEVGYTADDIHSLDDLDGLFAAVHEKYPDMICVTNNAAGGTLHVQLGQTVDPLGDNFGVLKNYGLDDLNVVDEFETDEYREYCEHMRRWYEAGYISPDITASTESGNSMVKAGRAFSYIVGLKPGVENQESRMAGMDLTALQVNENATYTSIPAMFMWGIPYSAENPELSMQYLNEQYTNPEIMNLLAWGIEGVHYDVMEDGHITTAAALDGQESGYNPQAGWIFGNQYITHVWEGDDIDLYVQLKEFNDTAAKSKAFGFTFDNSSVITETAAVQSVYDQYKMGLECGLVDPSTGIDEMVSALKAAGLDTIIAEKQAQLDAWAEENA